MSRRVPSSAVFTTCRNGEIINALTNPTVGCKIYNDSRVVKFTNLTTRDVSGKRNPNNITNALHLISRQCSGYKTEKHLI